MITIIKAETLADFREVHALAVEMGRWDAAECAASGLPSADVIPTYYADDAASFMTKCSRPRTGMYLARADTVAIGCIGHVCEHDAAEIIKLFVRPSGRGQGVGRMLLAAALGEIDRLEFPVTRLVTIAYMTDAIALYRKSGFVDCAPFEPAPPALEAATRYMERRRVS